MKEKEIVIAPNAFKESLSPFEVADILEASFREVFNDTIHLQKVPLADGGDGTLDVILSATGGFKKFYEVMGPLPHTKVKAPVGFFLEGKAKVAVIEMANAAGLKLIPQEQRDPTKTTTFGVGQLLLEALKENPQKIILTLGGSATVDGGTGILHALGFQFLDGEGKTIFPTGGDLLRIKSIVVPSGEKLKPLRKAELIVCVDVNNPLLGERGAARVYGPQKGASPEQVEILETGLSNLAEITRNLIGEDVGALKGGGAAGGIGAFLHAFLKARIENGFDLVSSLVKLEEKISRADLVITGEGKLDRQTLNGKVPFRVMKIARKYGIPAVAVGGAFGEGAEELVDEGFAMIWPACTSPMPLREALERAGELLFQSGKILAREIQTLFKERLQSKGTP